MPISTINQNGLNAPLTLTSPVLTTPNLGTPSAINLANATNLPKAALPTGSVLQVVQGKLTTAFSTSSTSLTSTGLTASITPISSSSKILVRVCCFVFSSNASLYNAYVGLSRNGTYLNNLTNRSFWSVVGSNNNSRNGTYVTETLDSPATTSSVTYTVSATIDTGGTVYFNTQYIGGTPADDPTVSTITLMEIAA